VIFLAPQWATSVELLITSFILFILLTCFVVFIFWQFSALIPAEKDNFQQEKKQKQVVKRKLMEKKRDEKTGRRNRKM